MASIVKKQFIHHVYAINALTNIHVGSGETSFNIIDKLVQRDVITNFPTIHSSSMKGALREYFEEEALLTPSIDRAVFVRNIFGSEVKALSNSSFTPGSYRFFSADLLSIPARSSVFPYHRIVSPEHLELIKSRLNTFGITIFDEALNWLKNKKDTLEGSTKVLDEKALVFDHAGAVIEEYDTHQITGLTRVDETRKLECEKLLGSPIALVNNDWFQDLTDNLPVIARNQLENGLSENLWYEQVVPRETRFLTVISTPNGLDANFELGTQPIQIGANASIGYGLTHFEKLN